ncbi:MAG: hypothetical protein AB7G47_06325 [Mycolicibacterium sp.]|uniref:hypothetical protein n=1 Tax=Mycolicibacterium sp. TaxID=2320850 RepID=UPI003D0FDACA
MPTPRPPDGWGSRPVAAPFDVVARLAEGLPAIETLQQYVWACRQLGYRHPDLTFHPTQLMDWYRSEEGMNLVALQIDIDSLHDAARVAQEALANQDRQLGLLSSAWQGAGARASHDVLRRYGEASETATVAIRTAREALIELRESLWQAVDTKVDTVIAIEGRAAARRADWLTATEAVTTGVGDRAAAAELVDQEVKPFVDRAIGSELLTAMRTAMAASTDAYRRATGEIAGAREPSFAAPGDFRPTWNPLSCIRTESVAQDLPAAFNPSAGPTMTVPSGWSPPAVVADSSPPLQNSMSPSAPPPFSTSLSPLGPSPLLSPLGPSPLPTEPGVPPSAPLAGIGSGPSAFGSGLSGLGRNLAEMVGGLLGGADGFAPKSPELDGAGLDSPELDGAGLDSPEVDEKQAEDDEEAEEEDSADPEEETGEGEPAAEQGEPPDEQGQAVGEPVRVGADSAPVPTPAPVSGEPPAAEQLPSADLPPADPITAQQTPCAIAADELPQVGEP